MKKVAVLCLMGCLSVLILVCGDNPNETQAQEQVGVLPSYGFESDVMPMAELGRIFEEMGREMQQNGSATFLGVTYPMEGTASIEFGVGRGGRAESGFRTNFGVEFRSTLEGDLAPRTEESGRRGGNAYTHYEGRFATGTPVEIADVLDEFIGSLATTGAFTHDFHSAEFVGTAIIDQYLGLDTENPRQRYQWSMDIAFGEGEVQRHDDREDIAEAQEESAGFVLGTSSSEGADQATVVESLRTFSAGLRSGQIVVGDLEAGVEAERLTLTWAHVAVPGGSDKIEMGMRWSNLPPTPPQPRVEPETDPPARYYEEPTNMPVTELAELLQRIAAEILEDGTFVVNGEEYTVGETLGGEIGFRASGMTIDVGWRR